ncbi:hypothetical protein LEM8419_00257 [Neolewinella maritima]|uniref:Glycosyltransferase n=1 Tax=Neolewinella maritima TaxID=1383882 RepID=A0ABN8EYT7_9BACT|nr:glycosyltransferase [Neolewinella maritima]CAH0998962.1 hypothetical protein LEM8419_00257 [Neolewinella maritima]
MAADISAHTVLFTGLFDEHGTGREKFRYSNLIALQQIVPDLPVFQFKYNKQHQLAKLLSLRLDGLHLMSRSAFVDFVRNIPKEGIAFFDGSNYGSAVARLRSLRPDVHIVVLYHNVESSFFHRAFKQNRRPKSLALAGYYFMQERLVAKYADVNIFLTQEDLHIAKQFYPGMRNTEVLPISVECDGPIRPSADSQLPLNALFVGGAFYANVEAARWLQEALGDRHDIMLTVVGKGFDRVEGLGADNIRVLGFVDSLAMYYNASDVVMNTIFSGSGMKTKVAEALYYGKPVVSTRMGINGYDKIIDKDYISIFDEKDEFVRIMDAFIERKKGGQITAFYPEAKQDYTMYYSPAAHVGNLTQILQTCLKST